MIRGVDVTIIRPSSWVVDRFGNKVPTETTSEIVHDAIIAAGSTEALDASRPEGVTVAYTVHIKSSDALDVEGASIELPAFYGGTYKVIGNNSRYMPENQPPRFRGYVPIEVEVTHG